MMPNIVQAAAEGMPSTNRRTALALTATGIVAALGGMAATTNTAPADGVANSSTPEPSQILILFGEWDALYKSAFNRDFSEDACERFCDELHRLESEIVALPATTAAEFAAKVIAVTNHGDFTLGDHEDSLLHEGMALIEEARS